MRLEDEERLLPFLCECADIGCERCVPATVERFAAELLFAPGHDPRELLSVPDAPR